MATRKPKMTDLFYGAGKQIRASGKRKAAPKATVAPVARRATKVVLPVDRASTALDRALNRRKQAIRSGVTQGQLTTLNRGIERRVAKFNSLSGPRGYKWDAKKMMERQGPVTLKANASNVTTLRSTVVRRKPNTAGLTRSKPKESTMATKKAAPKKSKKAKAAPRNYGPKTGAFSQATLRKMKPGALVKLQDKLYAQARAMPKGKGKAQIGRRALQVQKAYNALSKASGGKDRYDLTLNRQRTGVGDG